MRYFFIFIVVASSIMLLPSFCIAQQIEEKIETEKRIKKEELPKIAFDLLKPFIQEGKRTKYYKEFSKSSYYFEVKTIYKKEKISIKLHKDGQIVDIEVLKDFEELPAGIQDSIQQYLKTNYRKHKLKRIQIQYSKITELEPERWEIDHDIRFINNFLQKDFKELIIKFEIEAEVISKEREREFFEFLFDRKGHPESIKKIIQRENDNLLY